MFARERRKPLFDPHWRRKRILRALLVLLLVWLAVWYGVRPVYWWGYGIYAARQFERAPSQAGADAVVECLTQGAYSRERATELLELLLTPVPKVREAYLLGEEAVGQLETFEIDRMGLLFVREHFKVRDHDGSGGGTNSSGGSDEREIRLNPQPATPGSYTMQYLYRCEVQVPRKRYFKFGWEPLDPAPWRYIPVRMARRSRPSSQVTSYEVAFAVPVTFNVVAPTDTRSRFGSVIGLVSNPALDQAMAAAITITPIVGYNCSATRFDEDRTRYTISSTSGINLNLANLPQMFYANVIVRDASGVEHTMSYDGKPRTLHFRAGVTTRYTITPCDFVGQLPAGTTTGSLILRPDPEAAYRDPDIDQIWGGELVLPVTFNVTSATQTNIGPPRPARNRKPGTVEVK